MPTNIAIRLGVEGGPEIRRELDSVAQSGQAAFQGVAAAADASGAAVDRQTARYQKMAQAAREAELQARAQANINNLLGVTSASAGAARDSASVFEQELARQDAINTARRAQNAQTAQTNVNQMLGIRDAQVGAARASAAAFEEAYKQEEDAIRKAAEQRGAAVRNAAAGWRDLSAAGSAQSSALQAQASARAANLEASRRLSSLGMMPSVPGAANENRRLRPDEATNLIYQGGDIVAQLGSGSPLGMIAMQQGPQIAQIFAGPSGASIKGAATQSSEAVGRLFTRIGVGGAAFGAVTLAAGVGAAALLSYQNSMRETERMLSGVGRASGVTAEQINTYARAAADATGIGTRAAREAGGELASTGRIGGDMVAKLVGSLKDYAKTTGQDAPEASQELAKAFADPTKGADLLNERLGFLDDQTAQTIRRLQEQGDRLGAQRVLFDAYAGSLTKASETTSAWGRVTETVTGSIGDAWDRLGQHIDRVVTGGSLEDRIAAARKVLAESEALQQSGIGRVAAGLFGQDPGKDRAALDALLRQQDERARRSTQAAAAQSSREIGDIVRQLDPAGAAFDQLQARVEKLRKAISDPVRLGLEPPMFEDMLKTPENHAFTGVGPFERGIPIEQRNARLQTLAEVIHARGLAWAAIALIAVQAQHDEKSHEGLLVTLNNQPEEDRKAILDAYAARG